MSVDVWCRQARDFGDYLLVGILGDEHINRHRGANFPILNLNERVLSVMGCKVGEMFPTSSFEKEFLCVERDVYTSVS